MLHKTNRRRPASARAFTLIEILIVIAIMVILGGIVAVNVVGARKSSKVDVAKIEMNNIRDALEQFNVAFDRYPTEDEGLEALWSREVLETEDESIIDQKWRSFLKKPIRSDQWGNEWQYVIPSEHGADYDLWSYGQDGEDGTDDDIVSWEGLEDDGSGVPAGLPPVPSGG